MIDINEGRTGALALPGFALIIIAVFFVFFQSYFSIFFVGSAILLFLVTTGLELDQKKKQYRAYYGFFDSKIGKWKPFDEASKVKLVLNIEKFGVTRWLPRTVNDNSMVIEKNTTYNIELETTKGDTCLFEFFKYRDAQKALMGIEQALNIESEDQVRNIIESRKVRRYY